MLNSLASSLFQSASHRSRGTDPSAAREQFNRHLRTDAQDVVGKLCASLDKELRQVVDEMVAQANEFWQHQLQAMECAHAEEVGQLKAELAEAGKQLDDTVTRYNQVVKNLNAQLAEAQEAAEAARRIAEAKAAAAQQQSSASEAEREVSTTSYKAQLQELSRQLASVQSAARDAELKAQQKRLILVQTVDKQHKDLEELRQQLKAAQARDAQLTRVSEHLLVKQATLVRQVKELEAQVSLVPTQSEVAASPAGRRAGHVDAADHGSSPQGEAASKQEEPALPAASSTEGRAEHALPAGAVEHSMTSHSAAADESSAAGSGEATSPASHSGQ